MTNSLSSPAWYRMVRGASALIAALTIYAPTTQAADSLRIGVQFGMPYLPFYVAEHEKLFEKRLGERGLKNVSVTLPQFSGSSSINDAMLSGQVDMAVYAVTALLVVWEKTRRTSSPIIGVSGVTTMPASMVTVRPELKTLKDIVADDRIAVAATVATSAYVLRMASETQLGDWAKLDPQLVVMPNPDAVSAILRRTEITSLFTVPPFPEYVMRQPGAHRVISQTDVFGGPSTSLALGASKRYADANPEIVQATIAAIDDADALIRRDPKRAAAIYLGEEPSKLMGEAFVAELLSDGEHEYTTGVYGIAAFADFLARHGAMKAQIGSWKELFLPYIHDQPGS